MEIIPASSLEFALPPKIRVNIPWKKGNFSAWSITGTDSVRGSWIGSDCFEDVETWRSRLDLLHRLCRDPLRSLATEASLRGGVVTWHCFEDTCSYPQMRTIFGPGAMICMAIHTFGSLSGARSCRRRWSRHIESTGLFFRKPQLRVYNCSECWSVNCPWNEGTNVIPSQYRCVKAESPVKTTLT